MSTQDERRWAQRWLGAPVERLSLERRRELIEAAAARGRVSSRGARARLRENWLPIVQTAAAAALAWLLANVVFGHANPVFAPIAAIVSLGATRGQRARRAVELMLGVAVGITSGDLLTTLIGVGVWQLAVIVGLAMAAAVSLGAGLLMLSEAGVSATLVATVQATTSGFPPARLVDVLLGGAVALVFQPAALPGAPREAGAERRRGDGSRARRHAASHRRRPRAPRPGSGGGGARTRPEDLGGVGALRAGARHGRRGCTVRPRPPSPARFARRVPGHRSPAGPDRR